MQASPLTRCANQQGEFEPYRPTWKDFLWQRDVGNLSEMPNYCCFYIFTWHKTE